MKTLTSAQPPRLEGCAAALTNVRIITSHVADTDPVVAASRSAD
ncbi:hypothetical protein BCF46_0305 [Litoreibacter meonggei]|uniref:Uncharacterized protein n=1 Tax=Litoreibacter meonggei TaxID=1049199 RepID=A0A497X4J5_9RHOB|nr:hypothetical protein [Litoreibacter meonggei]RLJ60111.1 hypothetical protein BCF46_0305 [Litoreibacter meonggei]